MAEVRALFESLGYREVRTLLNSGNVVFASPRAGRDTAGRIERALSERLKVSARVGVIGAEELAAAVAHNPLLEIANDASRPGRRGRRPRAR